MKTPSLKKNFVVYLVRTLIFSLAPLVMFPYASRILGVDGIGKVQYAQSIASYFELLAGLGITHYAVREGAKVRDDPAKLGKLLSELLTINFVAAGIALVLYAGVIFTVPGLGGYRRLLLLFALEVLFNGVTFEWLYNIIEDYTYITVRTTIFQVISFAVLFLFVRDENDFFWYAVTLVLPYVLTSITNLTHSRRIVRLYGYGHYQYAPHIKGVLLVFAIVVSTSLYTMLDTTMLGAMIGDTAVGLYTAASKLNRLAVKLVMAICSVFLPRLAVLRAKADREGFQKLAGIAGNIILGLATPLAVGLWILAPEAISLFSGSEFMAAVPAMRVMCVDLLLAACSSFVAWQILMPSGLERYLLVATLAGGLADFILNYFFIDWWNVAGAASATVISEGIVLFVCVWFGRKTLDFYRIVRHFWQYLLTCVPFFAVRWAVGLLVQGTIATVICTVLPCAILYTALLLAMKNPYLLQLLGEMQAFIHRNTHAKNT